MPSKEQLEKGFRLGEFEVLPARRVLLRDGVEDRPEPKVFDVLLALTQRDGDAVSRDELVAEVWDGYPTADEPINRAIAQLRGHLGDKRPYRYVETLQRVGYRLMQKVVLNEPEASETAVPAKPERPPSIVFRGVVVVALMAMTAAIIMWDSSKPPPDTIRSIAVLPFENVSGDPANEHLVEGMKTQIIASLKPTPDVVIKTGREIYPGKSVSQIANIFAVDSVLFGQVNRIGDELQVSYEVIRGVDSVILVSGSVTGHITTILEIQDEVAEQVRADLFGSVQQVLVSASRPSNFQAYDNYMEGMYAFDRRGNRGNFEDAIASFEKTIELDPDFGPAYLQLATAYALLPAYRGASLDDSNNKAMVIVAQGIAVDASIEAASGAVSGFIYHSEKDWEKSELAYRRATRAAVVDSNAFNWYSRMLASVGRLDEALEQALKAFELDPESAVIASRVALSYSWLGDAENATNFFERARRLGAEGTTHLMGWALFLSRQGQTEKSSEVAKLAAENGGFPPEWIDAVLAGMLDVEMTARALESVNEAVAAGHMPPQIEIVVRTLLGDLDGAMQVASLLEQPGEAFEMDLLWIPEFAPLREHPDFLALMERLGIAEYWDLHGCKFSETVLRCPDA